MNENATDSGEVEVRITRFDVTLSSPLQMRPLHHQENIHVKQGDEVILSCVVTGKPAPLISWYVNNTQQLGLWNVATGRGVIHKNKRKSRLHISNMQPADSGNYSCLAENVNGYIKKTVEIYVIPQRHTTPMVLTTMAPVTVHPCFRYCLHGYCNLVDGRPSCSCISQYYGPRCEYTENVPEETKSIQNDCTTGCDGFFGRLALFSTLGALLTLLMLLVLCFFLKRKFHPNRPRYSPGNPVTTAPTPIPLSFYDAASVQGPGSVSRVCSPTEHPNSYVEPPRALAWMQPSQSAINNYSSASDSASHLFCSDLPLIPNCLPIPNRHLPQIRSLPLSNQTCPDV